MMTSTNSQQNIGVYADEGRAEGVSLLSVTIRQAADDSVSYVKDGDCCAVFEEAPRSSEFRHALNVRETLRSLMMEGGCTALQARQQALQARQQARQIAERIRRWQEGQWQYVGVYAVAEVGHTTESGLTLTQTIRSGGLWGIEDDSEDSYLREVAQEEISELKDELSAFGVDLSEFDVMAARAVEVL